MHEAVKEQITMYFKEPPCSDQKAHQWLPKGTRFRGVTRVDFSTQVICGRTINMFVIILYCNGGVYTPTNMKHWAPLASTPYCNSSVP